MAIAPTTAAVAAAAPTGPPAGPTRIRVTPTQADALMETARTLQIAQAQLAEQELKANLVQALIFDAHGIRPGPGISFDPSTKEIVVVDPSA